jgi:hypothetical protein
MFSCSQAITGAMEFRSPGGAGDSKVFPRALAPAAVILILAVLLSMTTPAGAVDFIRGDVNQDGAVTVADSVALGLYFFSGTYEPACMETSDVNSDSQADISDCIRILQFILFDEPQPSMPFPDPGPDPDPGNSLGCVSYGGGAPLEDPAARLAIVDAAAPGGNSRLATITVAASSSAPTAGYRLSLVAPAGLIDAVGDQPRGLRDLTGHVGGEKGLSGIISRSGR